MFKEFFDREKYSALVVYMVCKDGCARIYRAVTGNVDMKRVKELEAEGFRPADVIRDGTTLMTC